MSNLNNTQKASSMKGPGQDVGELKRRMDDAKNAAHRVTGSLATVSDRDCGEWRAYYRLKREYDTAIGVSVAD